MCRTATDCIVGSTAGEVRLSFTKKRPGDAKQNGPEHTGVHRHSADLTI